MDPHFKGGDEGDGAFMETKDTVVAPSRDHLAKTKKGMLRPGAVGCGRTKVSQFRQDFCPRIDFLWEALKS